MLDIISKGRASYILALGYRPEEFEQFGVDMRTRGRLVDEKLALLRELLIGRGRSSTAGASTSRRLRSPTAGRC